MSFSYPSLSILSSHFISFLRSCTGSKAISASESIAQSYIETDRYKELVDILNIQKDEKEKLLSLSEKWKTAERFVDLLKGIKEPDKKSKLVEFFTSDGTSEGAKNDYILPDEYEKLINGLDVVSNKKEELLLFSMEWRKKKCVDLLKNHPLPLQSIYDSIVRGDEIKGALYRKFVKVYQSKQDPLSNEKKVSDVDRIVSLFQRNLYKDQLKNMFDLVEKLSNPEIVKVQFIGIYSILERTRENEDDPFLMRKLRNHLAHDEQSELFREQFLQLMREAIKKIDTSQKITLSSFNKVVSDIVSDSQSTLSLSEIKDFVSKKGYVHRCVTRQTPPRVTRSIAGCLFLKEDVEEFSKGKVDENNVDKIIIDSEKFLTYIKSSQDKGKNAQLMEFVGNKNIEGEYKYLVDRVIVDRGYERYIQNEHVNDFYGEVLHQNSGFEKNSKLKSRLMNAAGKIQLIRGIHGAVVSCEHGTAVDCGLNLGGIGWSFASQPIENVMVKVAPKSLYMISKKK